MFNTQSSYNNIEEAFADIIKSIAMEETSLSNILNLEKEMIEKTKNSTRNLEEFMAINESVNNVIKNVIKLQMLTQIKLEYAEELYQKIDDFNNEDELEE